jgi:hypothetical protein
MTRAIALGCCSRARPLCTSSGSPLRASRMKGPANFVTSPLFNPLADGAGNFFDVHPVCGVDWL